jgi:hypothetical protein
MLGNDFTFNHYQLDKQGGHNTFTTLTSGKDEGGALSSSIPSSINAAMQAVGPLTVAG